MALPGAGGMPQIPDDPSSLPLTGVSAFVGQPPATQEDYYIIKGLFRMVHMTKVNPMLGYFFSAKPPPGYVHETRVPGMLAGLIIVCLAIILPTTGRVWLRMRHKGGMVFGSDDWMIILASLTALVWPTAQLYSLSQGASGIHQWEVTYHEYNRSMVVGTICKATFYVAVALIKLSIALFIRRLADRLNKWWRITCDTFIASIAGAAIGSLFYVIFTCDPAPAQWDWGFRGRLPQDAVCLDGSLQGQILSGIHVAQGLLLLATPVVILWRVRMHRAKKIRLFGMWIVGGLTVLGGLLRQIRPAFTNDFTWDYWEVLMWTCLDLCLGIMVANLPVMDAALERGWHKARTAFGGNSGATSRNTGTGPGISRVGGWQYGRTADGSPLPESKGHSKLSGATSQIKERSESSESIFRPEERGVVHAVAGNERKAREDFEMGIMKSQEVQIQVSEVNASKFNFRHEWDTDSRV